MSVIFEKPLATLVVAVDGEINLRVREGEQFTYGDSLAPNVRLLRNGRSVLLPFWGLVVAMERA